MTRSESVDAELLDGVKYMVAKATAENIENVAREMRVSGREFATEYSDEIIELYEKTATEIIDANGYVVIDIAGFRELVPLISAESFSKKPKPGYVYIVTDGQYVKIGMAKDVGKRVAQLQVGSPRQIVVLQEIETDDMQRVEESLHVWYRKFHVNGEWFDLLGFFGLEVTDYINVMLGNDRVRHEYAYSISLVDRLQCEKDYRIWIRKPAFENEIEVM